MTDIATLGIKVDASTVDDAGHKLDNFAAKGAKAEASTKSLKSATDELNARVERLRASVDPMGFAIDRVNAEMAEATALYKSGAISAADYAQAQAMLTTRAEMFAAKQEVMNARLIKGAGAARLTAAEGLNLSRQFADIGVSAAMGMNPLMILIQQGPQIADIMKTSGLSVKEVIVELLRMAGILKVVEAANDSQVVSASAVTASNIALAASNEAVAGTAASAALAEGGLAGAEGAAALAAGAEAEVQLELALTHKTVEETAEAAAKAEGQLAFAFMSATGAAQASAAASSEVAIANAAASVSARGAASELGTVTGAASGAGRALGSMGAAGTAAGAGTALALGPIGVALLAILAIVGLVTAGFAIFAKEAGKNIGNLTDGMGLTEKQLDRLKDKGVDTSVTMGDAFKGFFMTVKDVLYEAFEPQIKWLQKAFSDAYDWIVQATVKAIKMIVGGFVGSIYAIKAAWQVLPGAIGDIAISTANAVIAAIENMVNGAIDRINALSALANSILPDFMQIGSLGHVGMGRYENPYSGQAAASGAKVAGAYDEGYGVGEASVDSFGERWKDNTKKAGQDRIREDAGDPDKGNSRKDREGKSDAEREYEQRVKEAKEFAASLRNETEEIGKNAMEIKRMAAERAAAKAPTKELADAIMSAQDAWEQGTANQALADYKRELADQAEALEFETKIMGMNNEEREKAIAQREIDLKLREYERQGIGITAELIEEETKRILANAEARGKAADATEKARQIADDMRAVHDSVREAANAFGELFGTAGEGFADLITTITNYRDTQLDAEAQIAAAREKYGEDSIRFKEEEARVTEQMARAEIGFYGDMISSAKHMFKEKSTGWKVLEAIERAYRAYQMVSMIIEAVNVGKSIILDGTKTASSIANSGARASADGVAAIAKAIASLPFPLNLVAGAATAAALVAFGVKLLGGGGKGGATAASESENKKPTYSGPVDEYGAPTSSYSVLQPGRTTVANDNGQIASAPGMAAGSAGSSVSFGNTTLIVQGNVDSDAMPQLQEMLNVHRQQTVEQARVAVAEDSAARAGRQRIGGS